MPFGPKCLVRVIYYSLYISFFFFQKAALFQFVYLDLVIVFLIFGLYNNYHGLDFDRSNINKYFILWAYQELLDPYSFQLEFSSFAYIMKFLFQEKNYSCQCYYVPQYANKNIDYFCVLILIPQFYLRLEAFYVSFCCDPWMRPCLSTINYHFFNNLHFMISIWALTTKFTLQFQVHTDMHQYNIYMLMHMCIVTVLVFCKKNPN